MSTPLDLSILIACGLPPTQARLYGTQLATVMQKWGIDQPKRQAAFLAEAMYESDSLRHLEEDLWYRDAAHLAKTFSAFWIGTSKGTTAAEVAAAAKFVGQPKALANHVYGGRLGNGDEASGDGWTFRGRGIFQNTGRDNYHRAAIGCGRPYESIPDLLLAPTDACTAAAWFWITNGCNLLADNGDIDGITRKINPAMLGKTTRRALYKQCLAAFKLDIPSDL